MSGGFFDYNEYQLKEIANMIDELVASYQTAYSPETIAKFKEGTRTLRRAYEIARRIDCLVSGDDSEAMFHDKWENDIDHG